MRKVYIVVPVVITALLVLGGCTPEAETVTTTVTQPATTVTTSLSATTVTTVTQPATTVTAPGTTPVTPTIPATTSPSTATTTLPTTTTTTTPSAVEIEVNLVGAIKSWVTVSELSASLTSTGVVVTGSMLDRQVAVGYVVDVEGQFYDAAGTMLGTASVEKLYLYSMSKVPFEIQFSTAEPSKVKKCILNISSIVE